ncbi:MAG: putative DNA binding domain-containing protein [Anaerolineales bacterium]|nr:putative DNA binding domain-containing protein [Anaerolineales bacterium]
MQWYRMDLHLHTPGSLDYQEPNVTILDILRRAEMRGLDIIAFTDHNTVRGYAAMLDEIHELKMLTKRERALPEEKRRLAEYQRLLDKILVLPGFEFTATFGFHILGLFSPSVPVRQIEHVLLSLRVPPAILDEGNPAVGASSDVLTAYRIINDAGGMVIAAHANSTHGVAMRGFDFGGQTRIAYTQDAHLHALEVTDLDRRGRSTTARFFDGTKPEYPRRMRCIQGSDAHRLVRDQRGDRNPGVGDRITEIFLPERTFEAIFEVIRGNDFARTRPYRGTGTEVYDHIQSAREAGPSIVQSFHDSMARQGGRLYGVLADVCAFANTNGGTVYIGVSHDLTIPPVGVSNVGESIETLQTEISHRINPTLEVEIDAQETGSKTVIRLRIPRGDDPPYAIDDNKIYVREETETSLAVRDEIVGLVQKKYAANAAALITQGQSSPPRQAQRQETPPEQSERPAQGESGRGRRGQSTAPVEVAPPVVAVAAEAPAEDGTAPARRRRGRGGKGQPEASPAASPLANENDSAADDAPLPPAPPMMGNTAPRTGVEIVGTETRKGEQYHVMRDLRKGAVVKNVTRSSARRLWHYAIIEHETKPLQAKAVQWEGDYGLRKRYRRSGMIRYDLVLRDQGKLRIFYGVTEDGMHGKWASFISDEEPTINEDAPDESGEE